jgi:hypothetical protein
MEAAFEYDREHRDATEYHSIDKHFVSFTHSDLHLAKEGEVLFTSPIL